MKNYYTGRWDFLLTKDREWREYGKYKIMFEQAFKNIDDILHKDAGCGSELDYVEQSSWILFLKYLDDLESDRRDAATLIGREYTPLITPEYQWNTWAVPKTPE